MATTALTALENEIPNISNIAKKLAITKTLVKLKIKLLLIMIMINILNKFKKFTSNKLNKLTSENVTVRLKQANLASENDIANF